MLRHASLGWCKYLLNSGNKKNHMKTELSFLWGLASCLLLENSIKIFFSMEYTDDAVDKSDLSVHLTTGKKLFWLTAENC